jgi:hypothetical protein
MRATLVVSCFTLCACTFSIAQSQSAMSACGPASAHFDTQTAAAPAVTPDANKSQIYVIEVFDRLSNQLARPTLRIGIDGSWIGADKGNSYLTFAVGPGEHHLCANWQSVFRFYSKKAAFAGFTAEAGHSYYFRARIIEQGGLNGGSSFFLDLDQINPDEGKYLVQSSAFRTSRVTN